MIHRALVASLLALALAGCLSTQDEPFPLDGGDSVAARPGDYACRSVDEHGAAKAESARLIRLRRDGRTQYVFLTPDNSSAEPAALHRVADGALSRRRRPFRGAGRGPLSRRERRRRRFVPPLRPRRRGPRRRPGARRAQRRDPGPQPLRRRSFRPARRAARFRAGLRRRPQELARLAADCRLR